MNTDYNLNKWISELGPPRVAKLLKVNVTSVYQWEIQQCLPRPDIMVRIRKLSLGLVTCDKMVDAFVKRKSAKKRKATRKMKGLK